MDGKCGEPIYAKTDIADHHRILYMEGYQFTVASDFNELDNFMILVQDHNGVNLWIPITKLTQNPR